MIVREGLPFILFGVLATVALILTATRWNSWPALALGLLMAVLTVFTAFFFRDPVRQIPDQPGILVAPADGRVMAVDSLEDQPFLGGKAVRVSIFLSVIDVHLNRMPASGVINYVTYTPGRFFPAYREKASTDNEQTEIGMTDAAGNRLVVKQIAGIIARRIVCRLKEGQTVTTGERFGMIRFGSRTDLIFPPAYQVRVKPGDHVAGGETIMAALAPGDRGAAGEGRMENTNGQ